MDFDPFSLLMIPVFLFSITLHEFSHALSAKLAGDDTATYMGRLTLNPIAHVDIFGTLILPIFSILTNIPAIGWAKPVPVDPRKFKERYWDIIVSAAGPLSNLLLVILAGLLLKIGIMLGFNQGTPLRIFFNATSPNSPFQIFFIIMIFFININIILLFFNLIPIPPLDGSHILFHNVRPGTLRGAIYMFLQQYGFMILILLFVVIKPTRHYFSNFIMFVINNVLGFFIG